MRPAKLEGDAFTGSMGDGVPQRPLVSFIVLAYKQKQFIREAVQSALAQSYEPLEIILSDDASPDVTFEVMEDEVRTGGVEQGQLAKQSTGRAVQQEVTQPMSRLAVVDEVPLGESSPHQIIHPDLGHLAQSPRGTNAGLEFAHRHAGLPQFQ